AGFVDQLDDTFAADAAVDRAAEIDRIAEQGDVFGAELGGESLRQLVAHLSQRAVAMRLEEGDHPAGMALESAQRGAALLGVVAEIVDHGHARRAGPEDIVAAREPFEGAERVYRFANRHSGGDGAGN